VRETEVKLRTDDFDAARGRLVELGAQLKERVEDERDLLFRSTRDPEALRGQVLRLRLTGGGGLLTWKGEPQFRGGVKDREELQTPVADAATMRALLDRLGYEVSLEYTKRREYWDLHGLTVSLDELPFGRFIEIEGEEDALEGAVAELGLEDCERVREGYPTLAARHLGR
jgi:adenylate cyclase class 2